MYEDPKPAPAIAPNQPVGPIPATIPGPTHTTPEAVYGDPTANAATPQLPDRAAAVTQLNLIQTDLLLSGKSFASDIVGLLLAMLADAPDTIKYALPKVKLTQTVSLFGRSFTFTEALLGGDDLVVTETPS